MEDSFKICTPVKVAKKVVVFLVKMTPADFGDVDAIWKIAENYDAAAEAFFALSCGGDLQFTKLRKCFLCHRMGMTLTLVSKRPLAWYIDNQIVFVVDQA